MLPLLRNPILRVGCVAVFFFAVRGPVFGQPTYRLDVKPHLNPLATIKLEGLRMSRSGVQEDPGFRLQYHFRKDGKTVATIDARSQPAAEIPTKEAGLYSAALELFYPAYKGGNQQKGEFKAISETITYRVEAPAKAGDPVKVTLVEPPKPLLLIQCGRGAGMKQDEILSPGFAYKLLQGTPQETWPATSGKPHCWTDPKTVRFDITLPATATGMLRLHLVDGDQQKRKLRVVFQGKNLTDIEGFHSPGKRVEITLKPEDVKSGKIEVTLQNLQTSGSAVVSTVEFVPAVDPAKAGK